MPGFTAAKSVFIRNAHCGSGFFLTDEKNMHLMGQSCPVYKRQLGDSGFKNRPC